MTDKPDPKATGLAALREPFPPSAIGKLPRGGINLDYVGHAAVTDRLLSVDPDWNWEPMAFTEDGLPKFILNNNGAPVGLWIKLTVCGVTRIGYGSTEANKAEPVKELIGDALRNAAMRFGVALDLWSKSELESQVGMERRPDAAEPAKAQNATKKVAGPRANANRDQEFTKADETLVAPPDLRQLQKDLAALDEESLMSITEPWRKAQLPALRTARTYTKENYAQAKALIDDAKKKQDERVAAAQPREGEDLWDAEERAAKESAA